MNKEYDVQYADHHEEVLVLICLRCFEPLTEPTTDTSKFGDLETEHNDVWCPAK